MTARELYEAIGGNYEDALSRMFTDEFVAMVVVKFADDDSCPDLLAAWRAGDEKAAFEAAHRAKGVCANLSLTELAALSSEVCEALRPGNDALRAATDVDALVAQLADAWHNTRAELLSYKAAM